MTRIKFTKMHGNGNDFIVINALEQNYPDLSSKAKALCDRRFGIGCDQLLVVKPSETADLRMLIYNNDGSEVEMCGNGIRCFALYAKKHKLISGEELTVETLGGIKKIKILHQLVEVDMGEPILKAPLIPVNLDGMVIGKSMDLNGQHYSITCISMGNPHCVLFVENVDDYAVKKIGPIFENYSLFPKKINVEFAQILDKSSIKLRVWERGAGETLACGTGACATVVAAVLNGHTSRKVNVRLPGGDLEITWSEKDNHVYMLGAGVEVFEGEIDI